MTHMQLSLLCISAVIIYAPASTVHSIRAPKGPCTRASTPMGHTENAVEQRLRKRVEALGGLCLKFTSSRSGVPDRIVILQGRTIFVELKAPNRLPSNLQKVRIAQMRAAGADVRLIASKEAVDEFLNEFIST